MSFSRPLTLNLRPPNLSSPVPRWRFSALSTAANPAPENLVVIMGATGAGKSGLSIELASRFSGEVINSDKIQLYKGLNITTNKIPDADRNGVAHHLLGVFPSSAGDLPPTHYRRHAAAAISDIHSRRCTPFLVGGSNSLIHALLSDPRNSLRYRCCFLWVDVSSTVLNKYLDKRVDDMMDSGMMDELAEYYNSGQINETEYDTGIRKAIGVPEFEDYFRTPPSESSRSEVYEEAVRTIKEKTRELARRQVWKIERAKRSGWDLQRVDATEAFRGVVEGDEGWRRRAWKTQVVEPSVKIVKRFLEDEE